MFNEYFVSFLVVVPLLAMISAPIAFLLKDFLNEFLGEYEDDGTK